MKRLFLKTSLYVILILISLEVIVRILHLAKDSPTRYIDEHKVEKWVPNQEGYSVTGNRRQNFSKFYINNSGYNSYREFTPLKEKVEIALVGDSFIEGFHQNYYNSIGKKIENRLEGVEVYEYGYAGYDLADQLHLIYAYKNQFDLIDHVILGFKFENDLTRGEYHVMQDRMHLESPLYRNARKIKLLVYIQNIGVLDPVRQLVSQLMSFGKPKTIISEEIVIKESIKAKHLSYIENFKSLIEIYGFDKKRFVFLLDTNTTPQIFLNYLENNDFKYIDTFRVLSKSSKPTTLIYDRHWNNHGRSIIATLIVDYLTSL
ncbi:hypothetical protein VOI54_13375 [Tamlana sp. 2201CG12-4]|uniref:hypothetical protein n=1 Tax=Tamlana sp. 2201CG12-4 TaxID=3112582 RepID=UPI002DB9CC04|nr:hypothetical protein [Tamlana sp. 2201CG12-4]MEC3908016.1 hypothetical protein [Tamlana sp. 2201CG12-4]